MVSKQTQQRQPTSSLLTADNPNSQVDPVMAFLSGPYAYTGNSAEMLAGYDPSSGPLLASADGYSTYTGVNGLPASSDNPLSPATPWYSEDGRNVYAGYLGAGGQFVPFTEDDTILQTVAVRDANGNVVMRPAGVLSQSPTIEVTADPAEFAAAQAGDITDTMTPLQMELMDTDPNSARYQTLLKQQRATQWVQAFNNYDYATMGRIQTEEQAEQYGRYAAENGGRPLSFVHAPDDLGYQAMIDQVDVARMGIGAIISYGMARRGGASEAEAMGAADWGFNTTMALAGRIAEEPASLEFTGDPEEDIGSLGDVSGSDWVKPAGWRLPATNGEWLGTPGNSGWLSNNDDVNAVTGGQPIPFNNGFPDFSQWAQGSFTFSKLTGTNSDFSLVYQAFAAENSLANPTAAQNMLRELELTPHHVEDGNTILLIPTSLHSNIPHIGGASILRNGH